MVTKYTPVECALHTCCQVTGYQQVTCCLKEVNHLKNYQGGSQDFSSTHNFPNPSASPPPWLQQRFHALAYVHTIPDSF